MTFKQDNKANNKFIRYMKCKDLLHDIKKQEAPHVVNEPIYSILPYNMSGFCFQLITICPVVYFMLPIRIIKIRETSNIKENNLQVF